MSLTDSEPAKSINQDKSKEGLRFDITESLKKAGISEFKLVGSELICSFHEGGKRWISFSKKNDSLSDIATRIKKKLKNTFDRTLEDDVFESIALELIQEISELSEEASKLFLRFAESHLSDGRSDRQHNPSFKSCLLRIPGTLNSKCLKRNKDAEVKIISKSQSPAPLKGSTLLHEFRLHLADDIIKRKHRLSESNNRYRKYKGLDEWIEKLLQTPISDYRKYSIDLILAPYLIVVLNSLEDQAFVKMKYWVQKCNRMRSLSPSEQYFDNKIIEAIKKSIQKKIPPINLNTLQQKYPCWFANLKTIGVI